MLVLYIFLKGGGGKVKAESYFCSLHMAEVTRNLEDFSHLSAFHQIKGNVHAEPAPKDGLKVIFIWCIMQASCQKQLTTLMESCYTNVGKVCITPTESSLIEIKLDPKWTLRQFSGSFLKCLARSLHFICLYAISIIDQKLDRAFQTSLYNFIIVHRNCQLMQVLMTSALWEYYQRYYVCKRQKMNFKDELFPSLS